MEKWSMYTSGYDTWYVDEGQYDSSKMISFFFYFFYVFWMEENEEKKGDEEELFTQFSCSFLFSSSLFICEECVSFISFFFCTDWVRYSVIINTIIFCVWICYDDLFVCKFFI